LLGEAVGWLDMLGVAIVTAGIAAVQVARARAAQAARSGEWRRRRWRCAA